MRIRLIVLLAIALGSTACGSSSPGSTPSAPSAVPQPTDTVPQPTNTLSGIVFIETPTGRVPLDRVRVTEASAQRSAETGNDGSYKISGLNAGSDLVSAYRWDVVTYAKT